MVFNFSIKDAATVLVMLAAFVASPAAQAQPTSQTVVRSGDLKIGFDNTEKL